MTRILFSCATDTVFKLLKDEKYLGAKSGVIASLHTWTRTLLLHPHIHCLVIGGGLNKIGEWVSVEKNFLFPFAVARDLFRGKVDDAIKKSLAKGKIILPEEMRPQQLENLLNKLGREKWNVKVCKKYLHGNGVAAYLARYLRGGPIANSRIIKIEDQTVTFNYGRKKVKLMKLPVGEFIDRYLQHIPLPRSILVRSYGLYSNSKKADLEKCRAILGQEPVVAPEKIDWQDRFKDSDKHPEVCPVCGKILVCIEIVKPLKKSTARGSPQSECEHKDKAA